MKNYFVIGAAVVAVLVLGRLSFYTVDAAEYGYVTVLGEHRETYDGADPAGAGLKFGAPWPILQVQRLDRRLQQFDLPTADLLTQDPVGKNVDKILRVDAYVCWKIADRAHVDRFVRRIGNAERARDILAPEITGKLGAAIGKKRMEDFINTTQLGEDGRTRVDATVKSLSDDLLAVLKGRFRDEYGIELVEVRLRRFNHPASVRDSIFERIKSERAVEAQKYESDGKFDAANIRNKTDEDIRKALAKANVDAEEIRTAADVKANGIRNQAYNQDLEFHAFLKKLEMMQSIVGNEKTLLLLSTHRDMFESLFKEPRPGKKKDK